MKIAIARSRHSKRWRTIEITWSQFLDRLREPMLTAETVREYKSMTREERERAKEAAGGFVGGALEGGRRTTEAVRERWLITLDADQAQPMAWETTSTLMEFRMACYSTHSHTPEKPRLRWILPTDRAMTPDEYPAVARRVATWLDIETMDPTTYQVARLMYWPTCSKDGEYLFREKDGPLLSVDKALASYGPGDAWRDTSLWPIARSEEEIRVKAAAKAGDPTGKHGIVGLFCRTYDVEDVIREFLPDVYLETGTPGRYTYAKGTTAAGAVVYDDGKFLFSNHATDPCCGQSVNAFDLLRIHKYGAMDEDVPEDTPVTRLPSYLAMAKWAADLPEVKRQMAAERAEETAADFADLTETAGGGEQEEEDDTGWEAGLELNPKTGECEPSQHNAFLILTHDPALKGAFGYDQFAERPRLKRDVPWRPKGSVAALGKAADWTDLDDAGLRGYLQRRWKFKSDKDLLNALELAFAKYAFHPVREYLKPLVWDGTPRLDALLIDCFDAEDTPYTRAVARKWMAAAVARVMRPGCKFDAALVLVGPQGIGKSSFAAILSRGWYNDSIINMSSKDGYESIHGSWIIELSELASVKRADLESVKSFLSKQEDTYRAAYARRVTTHPRQCVFLGSTNEVEFLRDRTGARRFWPVVTGTRMLDRAKLRADVDQLWAEAVVRWKDGEYLDLDDPAQREGWEEAVQSASVQDELDGQLTEYLDTPLPENWGEMTPEARRDYIQGLMPVDPEKCTLRRDQVCLTEIRMEMCGEDRRQNGGNDLLSRRLANLMNNRKDWSKSRKKKKLPLYGAQWVYTRKGEST